jgi:hypothetical protein
MAGWITPAVWTGAEVPYNAPLWPRKLSAAAFTAPATTTALAINEVGEWSVVWVEGFPGNGFVGRFAGYSAAGFAENGDRSFVVRANQGFRFDTWSIFAITADASDGEGAVSSVFGRTGDVVATAGDYDSDLINNVSNVAGSSVSDALDQLDSEISTVETTVSGHTTTLGTKADKATTITAGAGLTGGGDLSANRTLDVAAANGSIVVNTDSIQVGFSTDPPAALGAAFAGVSFLPAHEDHVHPMPTAAAVGAVPTTRSITAGSGLTGGGDLSGDITLHVFNSDGSLNVGANDLTIAFAVGDPSDLGTRSPGIMTNPARLDHVHAHGAQAGGTQHAAATTSVAGFMSAADKTKLDGVASGATANTLALTSATPANVSTASSSAGAATDAARSDHVHRLPTRTFTNRAQNLRGWSHNPSNGFVMDGSAGAGVFPTQEAVPTSSDRWYLELDFPIGVQNLTNVIVTVQGAAGHVGMPSNKPVATLTRYSAAGTPSAVGNATDPQTTTGGYQAAHAITISLSHAVDATNRYVLDLKGEDGTNALGGLKLLGVTCSGTWL